MSVSITRAPVIPHPGFIAGNTYVPLPIQSAAGAFPAVDFVYYLPFPLYRSLRFSAGYLRVTTGGAGSSVKTGIWADSPASHRPLGAPLIVDNSGVATTSSSADVAPALTGALNSGWYWFGIKATGTLPSFAAFIGTQWLAYAVGGTGSNPVGPNLLRTASTYSNDMPTLVEGETFTGIAGSVFPVFGLVAS